MISKCGLKYICFCGLESPCTHSWQVCSYRSHYTLTEARSVWPYRTFFSPAKFKAPCRAMVNYFSNCTHKDRVTKNNRSNDHVTIRLKRIFQVGKLSHSCKVLKAQSPSFSKKHIVTYLSRLFMSACSLILSTLFLFEEGIYSDAFEISWLFW